jgi:hypothetical protein
VGITVESTPSLLLLSCSYAGFWSWCHITIIIIVETMGTGQKMRPAHRRKHWPPLIPPPINQLDPTSAKLMIIVDFY